MEVKKSKRPNFFYRLDGRLSHIDCSLSMDLGAGDCKPLADCLFTSNVIFDRLKSIMISYYKKNIDERMSCKQ